MPDLTTTRRPSRAARQHYRALVEIVYPTDVDARRRQIAGEDVTVFWEKIAPGEPVPEQVIAFSPWLVTKGRVVVDDTPDPVPADPDGEV
jgi:hypothetical protein